MPRKNAKNEFPYKFSFVMPVYNVEDYLAETVESILAQTMDFEQNCEIIFVNDGSPDNSEEVCLRYQEQFPNNVKYIKQDNGGVSSARNRGLKEVKGKYVSFLDSDDKLSPDTLERVYRFFEQHHDEVDIVAIKLIFFEGASGGHPLNYKFAKTRVIDITKEYDCPQLSGGSIFVAAEALRERKFDQELKVSEDAKLITEIILEKNAYGVVSQPTYYYRKRSAGGSAISGSEKNKSWYMDTPKKAYKYLITYSQSKLGHVPRYVQYLIMYDLQWRFKQANQNVLTTEELEQYKSDLIDLLSWIDDRIILDQRQISAPLKHFILCKKYGSDISLIQQGSKYFFNEELLYDIREDNSAVHIETLKIENDSVTIEGFCTTLLLEGAIMQFTVDGEKYEVQHEDRIERKVLFLGEEVSSGNCYKVRLPVRLGSVLSIQISAPDFTKQMIITFQRFSYLNRFNPHAYRISGKYIIYRKGQTIVFEKYSVHAHMLRELLYDLALLPQTRLGVGRSVIRLGQNLAKSILTLSPHEPRTMINDLKRVLLAPKRLLGNVYVVYIRLLYYLIRPLCRKPIWLISDRITAGGDNGEAFFRFANQQPDNKAISYFAIAKSSPGYKRLRQYGRIIEHGSFRYKLLFLLSDKVISSHADDFVINAFGGRLYDFVDLYSFDFVFLQHGIISNNLSNWLNRFFKNIALFVTSAKSEYRGILSEPYYYGKEVVRLTGLPRYDLIESIPNSKIILAPTWRRKLVGPINVKTGLRENLATFRETEYYKFYNSLINDERILGVMKKRKMVGEFYLHPALSSQAKSFVGNKYFYIKGMPYDYKAAFREGNVLITDYSSVSFDFAYLKKPLVYTQFDKQSFYTEHTNTEGSFSFIRDGFGDVTQTYDDSVRAILDAIECAAKMPPKYQKRVDTFFAYHDKRNCQRVYEAIQTLDEKAD